MTLRSRSRGLLAAALPTRASHRFAVLFSALAVVLSVWFASARDPIGPTARFEADAPYYYAYTVSLANDFDLRFANEYQFTGNWYRFGLTPTGRPANVFGIGPGLMMLPFFAVGRVIAKLTGVPANGFSLPEQRLAAFASLAYTLLGLWFAWCFCARRVRASWAAAAGPVLVLLGGPFIYYAIRQPGYSHPFGLAFSTWLLDHWDRSFSTPGAAETFVPRTVRWWTAAGALLGATALARPQLILWGMVLPWAAWDDRRRGARVVDIGRRALVAGGACLLVFAPQLVSWKVLYGSWYLVPQGPFFMRWDAPACTEVLFSSRNGLFSYAPLLAVAAVGLLAALRTHRRLAVALLLGFAAQVVANGAVWDWWAGGSFGGRRFDSAYAALSFGLAYLLAEVTRLPWVVERATRRAALAVALLVPLGLLAEGNLIVASRTSSPSARTRGGQPAFKVLRDSLPAVIGPVVEWTSYWATALPRALFAWRHHARGWTWDRVDGVFFLGESYPGLNSFRPATQQTVVLDRLEPFMLGFAWANRHAVLVGSQATLLVPLNRRHGPIALQVKIGAAAEAVVTLRWNGTEVARQTVPAGDAVLTARLETLRRGVNELEISAPAGTAVASFALDVPPGTPP